ncbi:hypothetical protein BVRB_039030, partial [Beta vulgaris subsp. vulgaris]
PLTVSQSAFYNIIEDRPVDTDFSINELSSVPNGWASIPPYKLD